MLKCSTSLWSADLTNLESEIRRVEPYSERFHLDVADGHYTPTMLFFPDLVAQIRSLTQLPLEAHLMTTQPLDWLGPFSEAGVDTFIFCHDSLSEVTTAIDAVKKLGKGVGISLNVEEPIELLDNYWQQLDLVTLLGTAIGIKGAGLDSSIPGKIRKAASHIERVNAATEIQADGGIRRHTVPQLFQAGADWIVPGSLMFGEDPLELRQWLESLDVEQKTSR